MNDGLPETEQLPQDIPPVGVPTPPQVDDLNAAVSNRHSKRIPTPPWFNPADYNALMPVWADRYNRIWKYDADAEELVMIIDPEASRF